jgi:hypothetical protein
MTTYIFNADNKCVSQSHNLAGLFTWARRAGGVISLECHSFPWTAGPEYKIGDRTIKTRRPTGFLRAHLQNGYRAETWFTCGSDLSEWAADRVKPRRNSWFSGAMVSHVKHDQWFDIFFEGIR